MFGFHVNLNIESLNFEHWKGWIVNMALIL
jgi:hypothetical protein